VSLSKSDDIIDIIDKHPDGPDDDWASLSSGRPYTLLLQARPIRLHDAEACCNADRHVLQYRVSMLLVCYIIH
jgi:hypothetical protein